MVHTDHGLGQHCYVVLRVAAASQIETGRAGCERPHQAGGRMKKSWGYRKLVLPIIDLLRQGITPEKIAQSLAFGIVLGVFPVLGLVPVLGSTTILCAMAAIVFRLNLPAIQLVNSFVYPLQLALLIPFIRFGEIVFRSPHVSLSLPFIFRIICENAWQTTKTYWTSGWHAMVAWCLVGPLAIYVLTRTLTPVLRRLESTSREVLQRTMTAKAAKSESAP